MVTIFRAREQTAKKNSAFKLGDAAKRDDTHNCVTCVRWTGCQDQRKSFMFRCSRFNENTVDESSMDDAHNVANFFGLKNTASMLDRAEVTEYDEKIEQRIDEMINAALAENSPIPPDLKIQDGEIPRAPNFYTWMTDERFTRGENSMPPFPKQIYLGSMLFAEHCPRCSDVEWFDNMKVDAKLSKIEEKVQFLFKGVCPKCQVDRGELVAEGELLNPFDLVLICGQRSTKTSSIVLMDSYNHHRFLKLPSPNKIYRQLPQQMFTSTYTSGTFGQVKANVWDPFINLMNNAPWFTNYHKFLARRGHELGEELAVISEIFVKYRHRNLFISPKSPSGMTMRGATRWTTLIDEISHMPLQRAGGKEAVKANAKDTYQALRNSLETVINEYLTRMNEGYYDLPKPVMYNASSPLTRNDYGMQLLRQAKVSDQMLGLLYPTWEFNPKLPREYFNDRFKRDPVGTARDFACIPPIGTSSWIDDTNSIEEAFGKKRNMYRVKPYTFRSKSKKKMTSALLEKVSDPDLQYGCILAIDVGSVNNCFAAETRVITRNGTKPIGKLKGKVEILTEASKWVYADFRSYGMSRLYEIHLSRHGQTKTIRATGNHRWFVFNGSGNRHEKQTSELKPGWRLDSNLPPDSHSILEIDPLGVEHGAVFGDGTRHYTSTHSYSRAYLVDHKVEYLLPYFKHYKARGKYWTVRPRPGNNCVICVSNLPLEYKDIPSMSSSDAYLMGFLSGYVSTDGSVDTKGNVMLNSNDKSILNRVRSIANRLGIATTPVVKKWNPNPSYGAKPHWSYKIFFMKGQFPARLLLNPVHRSRYEDYLNNHPHGTCHTQWKVESVVKTNDMEEVFCANVPGTHSFTLEDYILTGNSFAFSVGTVADDFDVATYVRRRLADEDDVLTDEDEDEDVITGIVPLRVLFSGEVIPRNGTEISQTKMYDDIFATLIEDLPIRLVISDRWQNKKLVQDMEDEFGIEYVEYTLSWEDFENFKSGMFEKLVTLPKLNTSMADISETILDNYPHMFENKPMEHLAYQFLTVQEAKGNSVVKGDATDDMFRTIALLHAAIQDPEMLSDLLEGNEEIARAKPALGVVLSNSKGGTGGRTATLQPRSMSGPVAMVVKYKR